VIEGQHNRRPDIVVFINGLPLGLVELKNASNEEATIWSAYAQLQTYKAEIPMLLHYNAALVVSDGLQARMGSVTANQEWFKVWRTIYGAGAAPKSALKLEVLVRGVFERQRFLDLLLGRRRRRRLDRRRRRPDDLHHLRHLALRLLGFLPEPLDQLHESEHRAEHDQHAHRERQVAQQGMLLGHALDRTSTSRRAASRARAA
jgi:hypothetical protein